MSTQPWLPWPYLAVAALMVAVFFATQTRFDGDRRPYGGLADLGDLGGSTNLLFILIDTLRADHLGCYGYERATSPTIDRLAATGVRFVDHLAQSSWTKTSMASLWTSLYPGRAGVLRATDVIPAEATLPAEIFKAAGYRTVAIWRNGWVAPNFGFSEGFESYVSPRPAPAPVGFRQQNPGIRLTGNDFDIVDSTEEFLRTQGDEPWFLYLHMMDVHQYASDAESTRFGIRYADAYDNAIHYTDRAVRRIIDTLEAQDQREHTVVVIASDHGEAFGEHGFEGHARDLHAETTRTPWIISLPFRLRRPAVVAQPTQNVDVWPTLLELLGRAALPRSDGRSRLAELRVALGAASEASRNGAKPGPRISHIDRNWARAELESQPLVALADGAHRFFRRPRGEALYDVAQDPGEQKDLLASRAGIADALRDQVEAYLGEGPVWQGGVPTVELNEMELGQLRALGYVVGDAE